MQSRIKVSVLDKVPEAYKICFFFLVTDIIDLYSGTIWQQFNLYRYYFVIDIPFANMGSGRIPKRMLR